MGIELIAQDDEAGIGIRLDQSRNMFNKIRFGPRISNGWTDEFASGEVKIGCQDLCAVSDVVELLAFDLIWLGRQGCPVPFQSLYTGFFVETDEMNPFGFVLFHRRGVQFADLLDLPGKLIPILNMGVLPVPTPVRL